MSPTDAQAEAPGRASLWDRKLPLCLNVIRKDKEQNNNSHEDEEEKEKEERRKERKKINKVTIVKLEMYV